MDCSLDRLLSLEDLSGILRTLFFRLESTQQTAGTLQHAPRCSCEYLPGFSGMGGTRKVAQSLPSIAAFQRYPFSVC